ncbi:hypothetical protein BU25DRAFT_415881 [Macroventuria anomochaeta]|uniref:Uncharacterized protein n=1 Tax=Macroventuria anomochaeta TaxID=301207 RepID=A0ACB6RL35_9PLEO|nr:uncharacterized protein BU25DRAFT_415881 [Macroventuria anomochaeta]KAF2621682.1 hypothetical protein BU25DRAFT_415881 [Macroventuria anomochaeta]
MDKKVPVALALLTLSHLMEGAAARLAQSCLKFHGDVVFILNEHLYKGLRGTYHKGEAAGLRSSFNSGVLFG